MFFLNRLPPARHTLALGNGLSMFVLNRLPHARHTFALGTTTVRFATASFSKAARPAMPINRLAVGKLQGKLCKPTLPLSRQVTTKRRRGDTRRRPHDLFTKPFLFSTFVVTSSFGAVAVVDRLNLRLPPSLQDMNARTPFLWPFVGTVILSNMVIFGLWNKSFLPPRFIEKYFLCRHGIPNTFSTLGSTFSHQNLMHLGFNMFAFYGFGRACCHEIGSGDTAALYLSCGVLSSWVAGVVSSYHPKLRVLKMPALGASGAVLGLVSFTTFARPGMEISLIFLPMTAIPAIQALGGLVALDCIGLVLGWKALGHAAHLTGVACGAGFYFGGLQLMRGYERQVRLRVDMAKRWYRERLK